MKFLILNGSLTPPKESNTQKVIDSVRQEFKLYNIATDEIVLRDLSFEPGTDAAKRDGSADDMTAVLKTILDYDGVIFATPIWWGTYSSYIQALMERMGYFDDWGIKNNVQPLYGKVFGALISGSDDGWQATYGQLFHFASYLGLTIPPDAFVSAVKGGDTDSASEKEFAELVRIFTRNQVSWAEALVSTKVGIKAQLRGGKRTGYTSANSFKNGMIGARR
jgi:multimeric flavodoxin WrbA